MASVCQISVSEFTQCSESIGRTRSVSVGMLLDKQHYEIPAIHLIPAVHCS